jgi:hypothetical protein
MARRKFTYWNRKFHIYLGLYFLLFLWLFAISGLVLNNTGWSFITSKPVDKSVEFSVTTPADDGDDVARALDIMAQVGITGEMHSINARVKEPYDFGFASIRPHAFTFVLVDFDEGIANVRVRKRGFWSGLGNMHTFASMATHRKGMSRDWWMTKLWSFATDALAVGVVVMLGGGIYMWWQIKPKRRVGIVCLAAGCVSCALFVVGLRLLFT